MSKTPFTPSATLAAMLTQLQERVQAEQQAQAQANSLRHDRTMLQEQCAEVCCREQWGLDRGDIVEWTEEWGWHPNTKTVTRHGTILLPRLYQGQVDAVVVRILRKDGTPGDQQKTLWLDRTPVLRIGFYVAPGGTQ